MTYMLTQQKQTCKIMQNCARILHARLAWHVHAICPFSCTILAQSCTNSCKSCKKINVQETQVIILAASLAKSCTISCKICARLCKNRARKGTYRVHVPRKSCMQDHSCTILHDLASSFLLGTTSLMITHCGDLFT